MIGPGRRLLETVCVDIGRMSTTVHLTTATAQLTTGLPVNDLSVFLYYLIQLQPTEYTVQTCAVP